MEWQLLNIKLTYPSGKSSLTAVTSRCLLLWEELLLSSPQRPEALALPSPRPCLRNPGRALREGEGLCKNVNNFGPHGQ